MFFEQREYEIRCEWGVAGVQTLAPISDGLIIVDVLSFSTCVDLAVSNGAAIYPYPWRDERAETYAQSKGALLAAHRKFDAGFSLSPASLLDIPAGTKLVLPSPNGAALTLESGNTPTFAGCLRNAQAVAHAAKRIGKHIAVIAAGERWQDGSLRPAFEDLVGAGAVIHYLNGTRSPEAQLAENAFLSVRHHLTTYLPQCSSGKELIEQGFARDVELAAALNVSHTAPQLIEAAYRGC
jgi:2-phosphosulfolactate phosphatase